MEVRGGEWWDEAFRSDLVCCLSTEWKCLLTAHCIAGERAARGKLLGIAVSETRIGVEDVWWSKNEVISLQDGNNSVSQNGVSIIPPIFYFASHRNLRGNLRQIIRGDHVCLASLTGRM